MNPPYRVTSRRYESLRNDLAEALRHASVPGMRTDDDRPYPFVDLMTDPGSDISTGKQRIDEFAEELADAMLELADRADASNIPRS